MKSSVLRVVAGFGVVAVAIALFLALKDDDGDGDGASAGQAARGERTEAAGGAEEPAEPQVPTIVVRNGKPVGGIAELTFDEGERVRFRVTSSVDDEVHVHGYDVEEEVGPGNPASFDFPATIEGVFEGELHGSEEQILELRVNP